LLDRMVTIGAVEQGDPDGPGLGLALRDVRLSDSRTGAWSATIGRITIAGLVPPRLRCERTAIEGTIDGRRFDATVPEATVRPGLVGRQLALAIEIPLPGVSIRSPAFPGAPGGRVGASGASPARVTFASGTLRAGPGGALLESARAAVGAHQIRGVEARVAVRGDRLALESFAALVAGGRLHGSLGVVPGVLSFTLSGAALSALRQGVSRSGIDGRLTMSFSGRIGSGGERGLLSGAGRLSLARLSASLGASERLARLAGQARAGEEFAKVADHVASRTTGRAGGVLRDAVAALGAEARFYRTVLEEVRRRHDLGTVSGAYTLAGGRIALPSLAGPRLAGNLRLDLRAGTVSGTLLRLMLGRVGVSGVRLSGTMAAPHAEFDAARVTLDGQRAPSRDPGTPAGRLRKRVDDDVVGKIMQELLRQTRGSDRRPRR
jgi:hypothetical protein